MAIGPSFVSHRAWRRGFAGKQIYKQTKEESVSARCLAKIVTVALGGVVVDSIDSSRRIESNDKPVEENEQEKYAKL